MQILTVLVAASYLIGAPIMMAFEYASGTTSGRFGYTSEFVYLIGVLEIAGGGALLVRRLATWAAVGLALVMLGAIGSHLRIREPWFSLMPLAYFVALVLVGYARRTDAIGLGRPFGRGRT